MRGSVADSAGVTTATNRLFGADFLPPTRRFLRYVRDANFEISGSDFVGIEAILRTAARLAIVLSPNFSY